MREPIPVWKIRKGSAQLERLELGSPAETLDQVSLLLPQGVYTSFRTYRRYYALHMQDHLRRLAEGAVLLGREIQIDPVFIRTVLKEILASLEGKDFRVRISIDLEQWVGDTYVMVEGLTTPSPQNYKTGVGVLRRPFQRENPTAKSTRFIENSIEYRSLLSKEVNEVLLFNPQDEILEGLSSNFFGVSRGILFTADEGILPGITRAIVLEAAKTLAIEVSLKPVRRTEIIQLEEAFLTSASRAVLPVRQIDQTVIGTGQVGPVTHRLGEAFQARIEAELDEI